MSIDEFITTVSAKLPMPVRRSYETMKGSELKLTGYKEVKGKPIQDEKLYKVPVPETVQVDHKRKLRLAWLRGGRSAVRTYLERIVKPKVLESLEKVIWKLK